MRAIQRAKNHLSKLVAEPRKVIVKEWADEAGNPLIIYYDPLTLKQTDILEKESQNSETKMAAKLLIMKAKDAEGQPLFTKEDFDDLYRGTAVEVVGRIAKEILGKQTDIGELVDEAEKN